MEMPKHAVQWFEIPVRDFARARKFYEAIFDYQMPEMEMGPTRMGILLHDQPGGGVGGAIVHSEGCEPSKQGTIVYLSGGNDLSVVLNRVAQAGGQVVVPKTAITPEHGFFGHFLDTEGNRVGLHSMK